MKRNKSQQIMKSYRSISIICESCELVNDVKLGTSLVFCGFFILALPGIGRRHRFVSFLCHLYGLPAFHKRNNDWTDLKHFFEFLILFALFDALTASFNASNPSIFFYLFDRSYSSILTILWILKCFYCKDEFLKATADSVLVVQLWCLALELLRLHSLVLHFFKKISPHHLIDLIDSMRLNVWCQACQA